MSFYPTSHGDVAVIEYQQTGRRWHPHSIVTTQATWDADLSRSQGLLVHNSGSGWSPHRTRRHHIVHAFAGPTLPPLGRIWAAPCVILARYLRPKGGWGSGGELKMKPLTDRELLKMGYERIAKPTGDPFKDAREVDGHIVYCNICDDCFDDEDNTPCDHLCWSDAACDMVGAGKGDHDEVPESFTALRAKLDDATVLAMRKSLESGKTWGGYGAIATALEELDDDEDCETALAWLWTLGPGKALAEARTLTLGWLGGAP